MLLLQYGVESCCLGEGQPSFGVSRTVYAGIVETLRTRSLRLVRTDGVRTHHQKFAHTEPEAHPYMIDSDLFCRQKQFVRRSCVRRGPLESVRAEQLHNSSLGRGGRFRRI